jgi:hypothetical protein
METRTKRGLLRIATTTAVICAATLVFVPSLPSPDQSGSATPATSPLDLEISSIRTG